jgi:pilus assembly protein Flp/PilA
MAKLTARLVKFLREEEGPTAVEYGIMMALIIIVCIASITVIGTNTNNTYTKVSTTVKVSSS